MTGNEWSQDMKFEITKILNQTPFEIIYAPENLQIVDDPSLRTAVGKFGLHYIHTWTEGGSGGTPL